MLALLLCAGCHPTRGCMEASFSLAPDSRVPDWFKLQPGTKRDEVKVTLKYFQNIVGQKSAAVEFQSGGRVETVTASMLSGDAKTLEPYSGQGPIPYPGYEILTANGLTEIIEHKRPEPLFYVNDDPDIRRRLGVPPKQQ